MTVRIVATRLVIALLLSVGGAFCTIGILTVFSADNTGAYAPTSSSDLAAWLQAVGSMAAIGGAFVLGNWQSQVSRKTALELEQTRENMRVKGLAGIYTHLLKLSYNTLHLTRDSTPKVFPDQWRAISSWLHTAIEAATQLPLHDLGTPERIFCAVRIRGLAVDTYTLATTAADRAQTFKSASLGDEPELCNVIELHLAELDSLQEEHLALYR